MKVKLSDIIDAIEMTDQYSEYFLDKETGKVEWVSDMAMTQEEQEEVYDRLCVSGKVLASIAERSDSLH